MKIRVSAVSYLNTLPFLFGLEHSDIKNEIDLSLDIPSECARKLMDNEVDLGLVPVAIIPQLKEYHIISNYCIGADGKVDTVALFSDVPLEEIENIYLDFHSKTSVTLVKVLAEKYWNINPKWIDAYEGFEENIKGTTAAVIIGDRTFSITKKYKYDLSEAWKDFTGQPFVFACWVSNKKLPSEFESKFNDSLTNGVANIKEVIKQNHIEEQVLLDYLSNKIDYRFDDDKKAALNNFLNLMVS